MPRKDFDNPQRSLEDSLVASGGIELVQKTPSEIWYLGFKRELQELKKFLDNLSSPTDINALSTRIQKLTIDLEDGLDKFEDELKPSQISLIKNRLKELSNRVDDIQKLSAVYELQELLEPLENLKDFLSGQSLETVDPTVVETAKQIILLLREMIADAKKNLQSSAPDTPEDTITRAENLLRDFEVALEAPTPQVEPDQAKTDTTEEPDLELDDPNDALVVTVDDEVAEWEDEFRPKARWNWKPYDYILASMRQSDNRPEDSRFDGNISVPDEFKKLVETHPDYMGMANYWKTAWANWKVLWHCDPPSKDGFTIRHESFFEGSFQQKNYEVSDIYDLLRSKDYGDVSMRIAALMELCLFDHGVDNDDKNFEYVLENDITDENGKVIHKKGKRIVKKGQFVARNMDDNQNNLLDAINLIVEDQGWVNDVPEELHLVDNVFNVLNSFDMRGHFFLDDTSAAVTKGFGGDDYAWECAPQKTIGYDINRYQREPKASWNLLSVVGIPDEWHIQTAQNQFFRSEGQFLVDQVVSYFETTENFTNDERSEVLDLARRVVELTKSKKDAAKYGNHFSVADSDELNRKQIKLRNKFDRLNVVNVVANEKISNGNDKIHHIREWFHHFLSQEDVNGALDESTKYLNGKYASPIEKDGNGNYVFTPKGPTFPTLYEFYMSKMMKGGNPKDGRVVTAKISSKDDIFDDDRFKEFAKEFATKNPGAIFQKYNVARGGWKKVLETIKQPPKSTHAHDLLIELDNFLGNLGKAKIVDGAHHNMMNVIGLLFFVKMFKYLEPNSRTEFRRVRNKALEKVEKPDTSGGGIPPQVKSFMVYLLRDAKSTLRGEDSPGDLMRPMDVSVTQEIEEEKHHETEGMEDGWRKTVKGLLISAQQISKKGKPSKEEKKEEVKIPSGPIDWKDQDTSTKEKK